MKGKLTLEDVVSIKRLLKKNKLTFTQIAKEFDASPQTISDIKKGRTQKAIQIDRKGELKQSNVVPFPKAKKIDKPVEVKVEPILTDEEKEIKRLKTEFIESFYTYRVNKKTMKGKFTFPNNYVHTFILALWRKYSVALNSEFDDGIATILLLMVEAVMKFQPNVEDFDWNQLNVEGSQEYITLHSFTFKVIREDLIKYVQIVNGKKRFKENGVEFHVGLDMQSLDKPKLGEQGGLIGDSIGFESNLSHQYENEDEKVYSNNHFMQWFERNKYRLLSFEQIEFINIMQRFTDVRDSKYTIPYTEVEKKPYNQPHSNQRSIKLVVTDAYNAEFPSGVNLNEAERLKGLELLNRFKQIASDENVFHEKIQINLSKYIVEEIDNSPMLWDLLYVKFGDQIVQATKGQMISNRALYEISNLIDWKIEQLENWDTKIVSFHKKPNEVLGGWTKKEHRKYTKSYKKMTPSGAIVTIPIWDDEEKEIDENDK